MHIRELNDGTLAIATPCYNAAFHAQMKGLRAQWKDIDGKQMWVFGAEHRAAVTEAFAACYPEAQAVVVGPLPTAPAEGFPQSVVPAVGVVAADGQTYAIIGGEFYTMLNVVKALPGRTMNEQTRLWLVPATAQSIQEAVAAQGYRLVSMGDLLDLEVAATVEAQQRILAQRETLEAQIADLDQSVSRYSRKSTSSIKAAKARRSARLRYALQYAALPIDRLTEPQVRTLMAVARDNLEDGM